MVFMQYFADTGKVKIISGVGSGGGAGANTALSNLIAQTAINSNLDPGTAGVRNFGDAVLFWNKLFIEEIIFPDTQTLTDVSDPTLGFDSGLTPPALYFNAPSGSEISNRIAGVRILATAALAVTMYFGGVEEFKFLQDRFEMNGGDIFELGQINYNAFINIQSGSTSNSLSETASALTFNIDSILDRFQVANNAQVMFAVTDANVQVFSKAPNIQSAALRLFRDDPSPVDDSPVGSIHFDGRDSAGNFVEWATLVAVQEDVLFTAKEGQFQIRVFEQAFGNQQNYMTFNQDTSHSIDVNRPVLFNEQGDPTLPVALVDNGQLYAKDVGGNTELFWRRAPDEDISQVSNAGGGGGSSFADDVFDVHDNVTPAKIFKFQLSGLFSGTSLFQFATQSLSRIYTFQNTTGTIAMLSGSLQTFSADIELTGLFSPATDLGTSLGLATQRFTKIFSKEWVLGSSGTPIPHIFLDTSGGQNNIVIEAASTHDIVFEENGTLFVRMDGGDNRIKFTRDMSLSSTRRLRAEIDSTEIGIMVDGYTGTLGTEGTLTGPYFEDTVYPDNAATELDFNGNDGSIGVQKDTDAGGSADARLVFRAGGVWYFLTGFKL